MQVDILTKSLEPEDLKIAVKNAAMFRAKWTILRLVPMS